MKTVTQFAFALLVLGTSFTAAADQPEQVTVTGPVTHEQVAIAKRKISLIQSEPGYYYAGAWGAKHRIEQVRQLRQIVASGERLPASVK